MAYAVRAEIMLETAEMKTQKINKHLGIEPEA